MNVRTVLLALTVVCALAFLGMTVLDFTRTGRVDLRGLFGFVLAVAFGFSVVRRFPRSPTA